MTSSDKPHSATADYPAEGFRLDWDSCGLEIKVTEYHPNRLRLDWNTVFQLAGKALGGSLLVRQDGSWEVRR